MEIGRMNRSSYLQSVEPSDVSHRAQEQKVDIPQLPLEQLTNQ